MNNTEMLPASLAAALGWSVRPENMKIKYEPRDLWVGIYWTECGRTTTLETDKQHYRVYVCIIPCFPIFFTISRNIPPHRRHENW